MPNLLYHIPASDVIFSIASADGKIININHAFIEASGYTKEELLGKTHSVIKHPDTPPELFDDLWSTITAGRLWRGAIKNKRKTGEFYWVDMTVVPVIKDGRPDYYKCVRIPITDKQTIEKLEEHYIKLRKKERDYIPFEDWGIKIVKKDVTRTRMNVYSFIVFLIISYLSYIFYMNNEVNNTYVILFFVFLLFLNKMRTARLLGEETDLHEMIVKLANGKYKEKINRGTIYSEALELLRANNASQVALNQEAKTCNEMFETLMDSCKDIVIVADNRLDIYDYNKIAAETLIVENESLVKNKDSLLLNLSSCNFSKFIQKSTKDQLRKRPIPLKEIVTINDKQYECKINPIVEGNTIKNIIFILHSV